MNTYTSTEPPTFSSHLTNANFFDLLANVRYICTDHIWEMTKTRDIIGTIRERADNENIITREDLIALFREINPGIKSNAIRNRIHQLSQRKIIYPITNSHFTVELKNDWTPEITKTLNDAWKIISREYGSNQLCLWSTKWFNQFAGLQAFNEIIFIEAEEIIAEAVYHKIADKYSNTYFNPEEKEIEYYISNKEVSYVVKPLITRSPIIVPIEGTNSKKPGIEKPGHPPWPRLEKLLTDLFYDSSILTAWKYEESTIWLSVYERYNLNFSTILNYAKRRDASARIIDFIPATLNSLPDDIASFLRKK